MLTRCSRFCLTSAIDSWHLWSYHHLPLPCCIELCNSFRKGELHRYDHLELWLQLLSELLCLNLLWVKFFLNWADILLFHHSLLKLVGATLFCRLKCFWLSWLLLVMESVDTKDAFSSCNIFFSNSQLFSLVASSCFRVTVEGAEGSFEITWSNFSCGSLSNCVSFWLHPRRDVRLLMVPYIPPCVYLPWCWLSVSQKERYGNWDNQLNKLTKNSKKEALKKILKQKVKILYVHP